MSRSIFRPHHQRHVNSQEINNVSLVPAVGDEVRQPTQEQCIFCPRRWCLENVGVGRRWLPSPSMVENTTNVSSKLPILPYTDGEYCQYLVSSVWGREETDYLFDLCNRFAHRLLVVHDRYDFPSNKRSVEDIRERYYQVMGKMSAINGEGNTFVYDKEGDRHNRIVLKGIQNRPKEALMEEAILCELMNNVRLSVNEIRTQRERILLTCGGLGQQLLAHAQTLPELMGLPAPRQRKNSISADGKKSTWAPSINNPKKTATSTTLSSQQKRRRPSVHNVLDAEGITEAGSDAVHLTSGPGRKPKPVLANTLLRSAILKPIRVGTTRQVDKMLLDLGLSLRPMMPTVNVCNKFNELRDLLAQLAEAKKTCDVMAGVLHSSTSSQNPSHTASRSDNASRRPSRPTSPPLPEAILAQNQQVSGPMETIPKKRLRKE